LFIGSRSGSGDLVTVNRSLTLAVRKDRYRTATVRESVLGGLTQPA
jgi:hypothetical protein